MAGCHLFILHSSSPPLFFASSMLCGVSADLHRLLSSPLLLPHFQLVVPEAGSPLVEQDDWLNERTY